SLPKLPREEARAAGAEREDGIRRAVEAHPAEPLAGGPEAQIPPAARSDGLRPIPRLTRQDRGAFEDGEDGSGVGGDGEEGAVLAAGVFLADRLIELRQHRIEVPLDVGEDDR